MHKIQRKLRLNAILVCALALYFWWAFEFSKHDSVLRTIIPFGEDPYDAVSSYGVIAATLLAAVSAARAYFERFVGPSRHPSYVLRTQIAVPFCVLVSLSAEAVAMARHRNMWLHSQGRGRLLIVQASLLGFSLVMLSLLVRDCKLKGPRTLGRAVAVWITTLFVLAMYPERLISQTPGHLLTVVIGGCLLFAPLSALIRACLPKTPQFIGFVQVRPKKFRRYAPLIVATAIGAFVGGTAYLSELSEGGTLPNIKQILFVGSVYVGLGTAGLLLGYAWLGKLLGFVLNEPEESNSKLPSVTTQ